MRFLNSVAARPQGCSRETVRSNLSTTEALLAVAAGAAVEAAEEVEAAVELLEPPHAVKAAVAAAAPTTHNNLRTKQRPQAPPKLGY